MAFIGFIVAVWLFFHFSGNLQRSRRRYRLNQTGEPEQSDKPCRRPGVASWHEEWHRQWAEKFHRQAERRIRHFERNAQKRLRNLDRRARRVQFGMKVLDGVKPMVTGQPAPEPQEREAAELMRRARKRAGAEVGFYAHLLSYLGVIALLALINLLTTWYPWFLWPAMGWGFGLFAHYMAVFGQRTLRERYFEPAVEREVRREKVAMNTEKQASIDELSATLAHEIRNPIAAAKSLVQQMGEDPHSFENVEYAKVALDELDRVERRVSHLLKYAKEEDYSFDQVNLSAVVDSALQQMRAKLDAAKVQIARNYISGPTLLADQEKLRQVFTNILANAVDALAGVPENRRIDLFVENGGRQATVRIRDNGCGIPSDKIDRIFNPFFTTKDQGTGLGMAISKKIVEAHEGKIDVVSEQGRSTEFVITLPIPQ
jgi:signal transduction histidine kinase